jgi:hypothetical protein
MYKRPFIKDTIINICDFMNNSERKEFKAWLIDFTAALKQYNRTENVLIFLRYKKGFTHKEIIFKTHISYRKYFTFFRQFKTTDQFYILRVKDQYVID